MKNKKAFGVTSAVMLGIGSMVGAGIFIIIGQAGAIAGNTVWLSFLFGGTAALLSGYSLAKLSLRYPSRGGIVEFLVQCYGENIFSGSMGILFYFSGLVTIAAVAKSFGVYASTFMHGYSNFWTNIYAVGIVTLFGVINLIGASLVAKSENIIVIIKLTILITFTVAALFNINPALLSIKDMPPIKNMLFAIGLTFFAYQGFSVITNTVEDMQNPAKNMLKAMFIAIFLVAILYVLVSFGVLGNLSLSEVIKTKDYALAEAAKPIFGEYGFKIMATTALLATASAINASLYATTEIGYTMAKDGNLPKEYEYNIFHSNEGLIISILLIIPMIVFFNLTEITTVATLTVLIVQGFTHIGHFLKIKQTGAKLSLIVFAILAMFSIVGLTLYYTYKHNPQIIYYLIISFLSSIIVEFFLRVVLKRVISKQTLSLFDEQYITK